MSYLYYYLCFTKNTPNNLEYNNLAYNLAQTKDSILTMYVLVSNDYKPLTVKL